MPGKKPSNLEYKAECIEGESTDTTPELGQLMDLDLAEDQTSATPGDNCSFGEFGGMTPSTYEDSPAIAKTCPDQFRPTSSASDTSFDSEITITGNEGEELHEYIDVSEDTDELARITGYEIILTERKKFTVYNIQTVTHSRTIQKRYSDFLRIRKTLEKDFPGELKQPFPAKRWFGSNVEPKFLKSRLDNLSRWFSEVIENESLRSHQALLGFLCLPAQHADMNLGEAAGRTKLQLTGPLHQRALTTEEVPDNLTSEPRVKEEVKITQENESPA